MLFRSTRLHHILFFSRLFQGPYDGERIHHQLAYAQQHRIVILLLLFEAIKHAAMCFSPYNDLYMYVGEARFSEGRLARFANGIISAYCFAWARVCFQTKIFTDEPFRLKFLNPILWPNLLLKSGQTSNQSPLTGFTEHLTKPSTHSKHNSFILMSNRHRLQFGRLVSISAPIFILFVSSFVVILAFLIFRTILKAIQHLRLMPLLTMTLPGSISTMVMFVYVSVFIFFVTLVVVLSVFLFKLRLTEHRKRLIRANRFEHVVARNFFSPNHHRMCQITTERLHRFICDFYQLEYFFDRCVGVYFCSFICLNSIFPYLAFFEPNPFIVSFGMGFMYVLGLVSTIWLLCVLNSSMIQKVSPFYAYFG